MKRADRLKKLMGDYVLSKGGELTEHKFGYLWKLPTKFGELLITVHDDDWGSIFGRFQGDDIASAHKELDCNPYSGKWNFHYGKEIEVEKVFEEWKSHVERLVLETT